MTAHIYILPVVRRPSFHDADWREQFDRECEALNEMLRQAPPRTRPLVVVQRPPCLGEAPSRSREGER